MEDKGSNQSLNSSENSRSRQGRRRRATRRRSMTRRNSNGSASGSASGSGGGSSKSPPQSNGSASNKNKKPTTGAFGICWPSWKNRRSKATQATLKEQEEASIDAAIDASTTPNAVNMAGSYAQAQADKMARLRGRSSSLEMNAEDRSGSISSIPRATKPGAVACSGEGDAAGDQPDSAEAAKLAMLFGTGSGEEGRKPTSKEASKDQEAPSDEKQEQAKPKNKDKNTVVDPLQMTSSLQTSSLKEPPESLASTSVSGGSDHVDQAVFAEQESSHRGRNESPPVPQAHQEHVRPPPSASQVFTPAPRRFKTIQEGVDTSVPSMAIDPVPFLSNRPDRSSSPRFFSDPPRRSPRSFDQHHEQGQQEDEYNAPPPPRYEEVYPEPQRRRDALYDQVVPANSSPRSRSPRRRNNYRDSRLEPRYYQHETRYPDASSFGGGGGGAPPPPPPQQPQQRSTTTYENSENSFQSDCYSETSRTMSMTDHLDASNSSGIGSVPMFNPPVPAPPPPAPTQPPVKTLEVSPGLYLRLRGAAETLQCVKRDFFSPCLCSTCSSELFCISDAAFVICPHCRVITPLWGTAGNTALDVEGGVGLGFTVEDLERMQWDAIAEEEQQQVSHHHASPSFSHGGNGEHMNYY